MANSESALVIPVPEAETLVEPFRTRFDPSAALGVPAHITLLYPFVEPRQIDHHTLGVIAACFEKFAPIDFTLGAIRRFPAETVYLEPNPGEPFRALTQAIWKQFPDRPPYGGIWADIVPHLSLGRFEDEAKLNEAMHDLTLAWSAALPIRARATEAVLIENEVGRWNARHTFKLGA
jgi:hypothetical protein